MEQEVQLYIYFTEFLFLNIRDYRIVFEYGCSKRIACTWRYSHATTKPLCYAKLPHWTVANKPTLTANIHGTDKQYIEQTNKFD